MPLSPDDLYTLRERAASDPSLRIREGVHHGIRA
jgi:aerobic carbon-monoxide dehydrogenase large subunit